jgi:5-methylcytosine-specific restriction endonuclease McrA
MSPSSAVDRSRELRALLGQERNSLVEFILRLSDFNRLKCWAELGYASLWLFLRKDLGLSEAMASYRSAAAELVGRFPQIIEPLRDGRLCITNLIKLRGILTEENCEEVLAQVAGQPTRQVELMAAAYKPKPAVRDTLRPLPPLRTVEVALDGTSKTPARTVQVELPPARRDAVKPLAPTQHRLAVTVSSEFVQDLEQARAALSRKFPGADLATVLHEGLRLILKEQRRRKALTTSPRPTKTPARPGPAGERYIPAEVRREVWSRDQGRCQEPLASGGICGSTHRVEFHHRHEHARGGPATSSNLTLRCSFHNFRAAERSYGEKFMDRFRRSAPRQPPDP